MRALAITVLVTMLAIGSGAPAHAREVTARQTVRFGLTAVIVRENLRFLDRLSAYLSDKIGRPVEFVRRRSYRDVMDMLKAGDLEFAWICGFPFVQRRDPEFLDLLAVPIYAGQPLYHSYIIVHKDSRYDGLDDLRGRVFALSDPDSNSGFLYPQYRLAEEGQTLNGFFRQTFFTYSHAETVQSVAEQVADGGAVDSYIWDFLSLLQPDLVARTRIIERSPPFGFPPLVTRRGIDPNLARDMKAVLTSMRDDPEGQRFLAGLMLDRFEDQAPELFDDIARMASAARRALFWLATDNKGAQR